MPSISSDQNLQQISGLGISILNSALNNTAKNFVEPIESLKEETSQNLQSSNEVNINGATISAPVYIPQAGRDVEMTSQKKSDQDRELISDGLLSGISLPDISYDQNLQKINGLDISIINSTVNNAVILQANGNININYAYFPETVREEVNKKLKELAFNAESLKRRLDIDIECQKNKTNEDKQKTEQSIEDLRADYNAKIEGLKVEGIYVIAYSFEAYAEYAETAATNAWKMTQQSAGDKNIFIFAWNNALEKANNAKLAWHNVVVVETIKVFKEPLEESKKKLQEAKTKEQFWADKIKSIEDELHQEKFEPAQLIQSKAKKAEDDADAAIKKAEILSESEDIAAWDEAIKKSKDAEDAWRETSAVFKEGLNQSLDQFKNDWNEPFQIANHKKIDWATKSAECISKKEATKNDVFRKKVEKIQARIKDAEHHASNSLESLTTIKGDEADIAWEIFSQWSSEVDAALNEVKQLCKTAKSLAPEYKEWWTKKALEIEHNKDQWAIIKKEAFQPPYPYLKAHWQNLTTYFEVFKSNPSVATAATAKNAMYYFRDEINSAAIQHFYEGEKAINNPRNEAYLKLIETINHAGNVVDIAPTSIAYHAITHGGSDMLKSFLLGGGGTLIGAAIGCCDRFFRGYVIIGSITGGAIGLPFFINGIRKTLTTTVSELSSARASADAIATIALNKSNDDESPYRLSSELEHEISCAAEAADQVVAFANSANKETNKTFIFARDRVVGAVICYIAIKVNEHIIKTFAEKQLEQQLEQQLEKQRTIDQLNSAKQEFENEQNRKARSHEDWGEVEELTKRVNECYTNSKKRTRRGEVLCWDRARKNYLDAADHLKNAIEAEVNNKFGKKFGKNEFGKNYRNKAQSFKLCAFYYVEAAEAYAAGEATKGDDLFKKANAPICASEKKIENTALDYKILSLKKIRDIEERKSNDYLSSDATFKLNCALDWYERSLRLFEQSVEYCLNDEHVAAATLLCEIGKLDLEIAGKYTTISECIEKVEKAKKDYDNKNSNQQSFFNWSGNTKVEIETALKIYKQAKENFQREETNRIDMEKIRCGKDFSIEVEKTRAYLKTCKF